jgi:hypothetical protein
MNYYVNTLKYLLHVHTAPSKMSMATTSDVKVCLTARRVDAAGKCAMLSARDHAMGTTSIFRVLK